MQKWVGCKPYSGGGGAKMKVRGYKGILRILENQKQVGSVNGKSARVYIPMWALL